MGAFAVPWGTPPALAPRSHDSKAKQTEFVSVCAVIQLLVAMTLRLIWWKSQQYPGPMQRRVQQYSHSESVHLNYSQGILNFLSCYSFFPFFLCRFLCPDQLLKEKTPHPTSCPRGAQRAVTAYQLFDLYDFFQARVISTKGSSVEAFIKERNMYYIDPNIAALKSGSCEMDSKWIENALHWHAFA